MGFIMKIKIKNLPTYFDDFNSWCVDDNAKKECMHVCFIYGYFDSIHCVFI